MSESRGKNLSAERIDALLFALGLSDAQSPGRDMEPKSMMPIHAERISSPARKSSLAAFPRPAVPHPHLDPSDMDEAQVFGRDYLSDFDICSDFGEDSDLELGTTLALALMHFLNSEFCLQILYPLGQDRPWTVSRWSIQIRRSATPCRQILHSYRPKSSKKHLTPFI